LNQNQEILKKAGTEKHATRWEKLIASNGNYIND
jgi:hypothetical protein